MRNTNKKGFTMVELLVVLVIVAILAAVATPIYLANVKRSRASEAVATMALVRQAERDFKISGAYYFDVAADDNTGGSIVDPLPVSVTAAGDPTPAAGLQAGLAIDPGVSQYFANLAFSVDAGAGNTDSQSGLFSNPDVVDFLVTAEGDGTVDNGGIGENELCSTNTETNCATKATEVADYILEMDNSGRTFVSYDGGTNWSIY